MRKQLLALALLSATAGLATQQASTASNTFAVESNTASYRAVGLDNTSSQETTLKSISYTSLVPGTITEVKALLSGDLGSRTIRAGYGNDSAVQCTKTLISLVGGLLGAKDTEITCGGLSEDADRPRALTFLIS